MEYGKIIFLNGTSSSGKTTLAKKLQEKLTEHYFHLSIDTFCDMAPSDAFQRDLWKLTYKCFNGLHNTINLYSELGYNVIVDEIFMECDEDWWEILHNCLDILKGKQVMFVKVDCALDELERRELERGNREIGLAKEQYEEVHKNHIYDLEVNTSNNTPDECADIIMDKLQDISKCYAFQLMYKKFNSR